MKVEFSYLMDTREISDKEKFLKLEANQEERDALAKRFKIPAVLNLSASIKVYMNKHHEVMVEGGVKAKLELECTENKGAFESFKDFNFSVLYTKSEERLAQYDEVDSQIDAEVYPEDHMIDLGELVSQYLSLEIEFYPVNK